MKNKNTKQVKRLSKKQIILILLTFFLLISAGLIIYRLFFIKQIVLNEKTLKAFQEPPTAAISYKDGVLIGNSQGYIAYVDNSGKVQFSKKIDDKIFGLVSNPSDGSVFIAGVKFHILDKDFKELFNVGFDNYIPRDPFATFLNDGGTKLLFQSLKDLSYLIVTVDKSGKVVAKDVVPDMGQNSQISIDSTGAVAFILEGGDLYLLNGSRIVAKTSIGEKQTSSISNAFAYFTNGNIVAGYKVINAESSQNGNAKSTLPVYFYTNSLSQLAKTSFDDNINNIFIGKNKVVFATNSGFYFYDSRGNLLNNLPKTDFTPYEYLEGAKVKAFIYKNINPQGTIFYQAIIKDSRDREIGRFIKAFTTDNPIFIVSQNSQNVYIIEGVELKVLTK